jgi:hypothetical protein
VDTCLSRVEDDVLQAELQIGRSQREPMLLFRVGGEAVEKGGRACRRRLSKQARERGRISAVTLPRRAEASKKMHLEPGRAFELIRRQCGHTLVEIVGDPHRPHRVGTRWSRTHLEELVDGRQHRPFGSLHHCEIRGDTRYLSYGLRFGTRLRFGFLG